MPLVSFAPGPSKVYPQVAAYLQDAYQSGVLSLNHRSSGFMELCEQALTAARQKLAIPADYLIAFTGSATECWEILAQSLTLRGGFHLHNGSFGQKWHQWSAQLRPGSVAQPFEINEALAPGIFAIPKSVEMLCFTQNETSNGTQVSPAVLTAFRQSYPEALVAVDATSSLGGVALPFADTDVVFGSVQKCLGLPAGLGVLILSPRAVERCRQIGEKGHYNSLLTLVENIEKFQTPYTPNVLGIYLLGRVLAAVEPITAVSERLRQQAAEWYAWAPKLAGVRVLAANPEVRSATVIALQGSESWVAAAKETAKKAGFAVGGGYGPWAKTTIRLANFPAHDPTEITALRDVLTSA